MNQEQEFLSKYDFYYLVAEENDVTKKDLEPEMVVEGIEFEDTVFHEVTGKHIMFIECTFKECIFSSCDFSECDFSSSIFLECQFSETNFKHCMWKKVSNRDCMMHKVDFTGSDCSGSIFEKSMGYEVTMNEVNLQESFVKHNNWSRSSIVGVNFKKAVLFGNTIAESTIGEWDLEGILEFGYAVFAGMEINDFVLAGLSIDHLVFMDSELNGCDFSKAKIGMLNVSSSKFKETSFDQIDTKMMQCSKAEFVSCSFIESNITKSNFYSAKINGCNFTKAILTHSTFREAIVGDSVFDEADLSANDFESATISDCGLTSMAIKGTMIDGLLEQNNDWSGTNKSSVSKSNEKRKKALQR